MPSDCAVSRDVIKLSLDFLIGLLCSGHCIKWFNIEGVYDAGR